MSVNFEAKITKYNAKLDGFCEIAKKAVKKPSDKNLEKVAQAEKGAQKILNKALDLKSKAEENLEKQSQSRRLQSRCLWLGRIGKDPQKIDLYLSRQGRFEKRWKGDAPSTWDELSPVCDAFRGRSATNGREEAFDMFANLPLKVQEKIIAKNPQAKGREVALSILSYHRSSLIESIIYFAEAKDRGTAKTLILALPQKIQDGIKKEINELKETDDAVKKALKEDKWKPWVIAKAAEAYRPNFDAKIEKTDQKMQSLLTN